MNQKTKKEILKRLLVEFREDGIPDSLKERRFQVNKMKGKANVLTGIRRSGKTYRMFQIIKETGLDKCYYINFEDERIINPTVGDLSSVLPLIEETFETQKPIYLFIDEIQNVDGWEKWARRLAERDDVIIFMDIFYGFCTYRFYNFLFTI
ncbi:MAG: AAA family ATPase, partial [Candidatus Aenigmatarchaeota archaeon]